MGRKKYTLFFYLFTHSNFFRKNSYYKLLWKNIQPVLGDGIQTYDHEFPLMTPTPGLPPKFRVIGLAVCHSRVKNKYLLMLFMANNSIIVSSMIQAWHICYLQSDI